MPEPCRPEPLAPRARDTARGRGTGSGATSALGLSSFGLRSFGLRSPGLRSLSLGSLTLASLGLVLAAQAAPAPAHFKWIGSDGTVNYGDSPPPDVGRIGSATSATPAHPVPPTTAAPSSAPGGTRLPYELRVAAQRHPVTLYTTTECPPCKEARAYLGQRGVPHEERSVRTDEDASAFRALGFAELSFPALRIGTGTLIGFEPGGWNRALDSAGYPKTSQLPSNWQSAPAKPMTKAAVPAMATSGSKPSTPGGAEPTTHGGSEPTSREEAASATDAADAASSSAATQTSDTRIREARRREALPRDTSTIRF